MNKKEIVVNTALELFKNLNDKHGRQFITVDKTPAEPGSIDMNDVNGVFMNLAKGVEKVFDELKD